jgi:ribonuclease HI
VIAASATTSPASVTSVTLYADASFHPKSGSGWGIWIRWSTGRIVRSGRGPSHAKDSNEAEFAAIYAGMH